MSELSPKQILGAIQYSNHKNDWGDFCEICGCAYSFDEIGFRGVCYDCKSARKITAKDIDDAVNKLIERYGEFNANLQGKKSKNSGSNSDS